MDKLDTKAKRILGLYRILDGRKRIFVVLLTYVTFMLMVMPFWMSFQDGLTRFVMRFGWYRVIQTTLVPYELRIISTILTLMGMPVRARYDYFEWVGSSSQMNTYNLAWNCIGWQTFVLVAVSMIIGLRGGNRALKLEVFLIGVFGTYLFNLARLSVVLLAYYWGGKLWGTVFHSYLSSLFTILWLWLYWWFAYAHLSSLKK